MAKNRAHLVSLRWGSRGQVTTLVWRLGEIFDDKEINDSLELHQLEAKYRALSQRFQTIEDLDQRILNLNQADVFEADMAAVDTVNTVYQDALKLYQPHINVLRRAVEAADLDLRRGGAAPIQPQQVIVPARATNKTKITLPRFNVEILNWQPFLQAFKAEIDFDDPLANINKFNYLDG